MLDVHVISTELCNFILYISFKEFKFIKLISIFQRYILLKLFIYLYIQLHGNIAA